MYMTNSELYITAYMRHISSFANRKSLVFFFFKRIVEYQDLDYIENNYCPRVSVDCSGMCHACWQKTIDAGKREGGPSL
jgi:hypothetical protein